MSNHEDWDSVSVSSVDSDDEHSCEEKRIIPPYRPIEVAVVHALKYTVDWMLLALKCAAAVALVSAVVEDDTNQKEYLKKKKRNIPGNR